MSQNSKKTGLLSQLEVNGNPLKDASIISFIYTGDLKKSLNFYCEKLGFEKKMEDATGVTLSISDVPIRIIFKEGFRASENSVVGFTVKQIEEKIIFLKNQGIQFEFYSLFPGQSDSGIWLTLDGTKVAWIKDPDGNIIALTENSNF